MVKKNPKVSVVMIAYNEGKYIRSAIESILNQSFERFELVIIDDASKDETTGIIQKYKNNYNIINFVKNKNNLGAPKCRNIGLEKCAGDYIAILDADDVAIEGRLKKQCNYLESNRDIFICGSSSIKISKKGHELGINSMRKRPETILPKENKIVHSSVMFRNDEQFRYRDKFSSSHDYDLWLRMLSQDKKFYNMQEPLVKKRMTPDSITQSNNKQQQFYAEKAREFYEERQNKGYDSYNELEKNKSFKIDEMKDEELDYLVGVITTCLKNSNEKLARDYYSNYAEKSQFNKERLLIRLSVAFPTAYKVYTKIKT